MSDINSLPHLDTATGPGEYQWCGVRVEIRIFRGVWYGHAKTVAGPPMDAMDHATLEECVSESKRLLTCYHHVSVRLIREHAVMLKKLGWMSSRDDIYARIAEEAQ